MRQKFLLLVVVLSCIAGYSNAAIRRAFLENGSIEGMDKGGVTAFLGIPFAAPPLAELRWAPPRAAVAWSGTRTADHYSSSCMQRDQTGGFGPWTPEYIIPGPVSEDCLYLNVWTPAESAGDRLPVFFWIHGGGYNSGSGSVAIYDGERLARQGIIVITVNYRVGVLGFLAHPELTAESEHHSSGNYGLLDLLAALRWTRENVAALGGDPDRVTIAGQSAGAGAVQHLLASPLARGLFQQCIIESGPGAALYALTTLEKAEENGVAYMRSKKAQSIADLRDLRAVGADLESTSPASEPTTNAPPIRFGPDLDGWFLPKVWPGDTAPEVDQGRPIPILAGFTNDEGSASPNYGKATREEFEKEARRRYGDLADGFLELYPVTGDTKAGEIAKEAARDRTRVGTYDWARHRVANGRGPTFIYIWGHAEPGHNAEHYGAFHSSEVPYVFDNLGKADRPYTEEDHRIATIMATYWANFVKTGDPNGKGVPNWPAAELRKPEIMELGTTFESKPVTDAIRLRFFEKYLETPEAKAKGWRF
jgi:para-nitrobenzyl esterase